MVVTNQAFLGFSRKTVHIIFGTTTEYAVVHIGQMTADSELAEQTERIEQIGHKQVVNLLVL